MLDIYTDIDWVTCWERKDASQWYQLVHHPGNASILLPEPELFTSVTCSQGEPALICGKHTVLVAELLILVSYGECQSSSTVLDSEHRVSGPLTTLMKTVSDCLFRDIHTSGLLEVIL